MPVDAVGGDIERAVLEPFDRNLARPEGRVLDACVGIDPVDAPADLAPERVGVSDRAVVKALIALRIDPSAGRPVLRYRMERFRHGLFLPRPYLAQLWRVRMRVANSQFDQSG